MTLEPNRSAPSGRKPSTARKWLSWVVGVCLVAFIVYRAVWFNYDREVIYRAVPSNAHWISEHSAVASRWQSLSTNRSVEQILVATGMTPDNAKAMMRNPDLASLLNVAARRTTVAARVPALGPSGEPAWVMSSWAGWRGQFSRWSFSAGLSGKFRKQVVDRGRTVWILPEKQKPGAAAPEQWSLAFAEGLVLACRSRDPMAVRYLVQRVECRAPLAEALEKHLHNANVVNPEASDRGWWVLENTSSGVKGDTVLDLQAWATKAGGTAGCMGGIRGMRASPPVGETADLKTLEAFLGNTPDFVAVGSTAHLDSLLSYSSVPRYVRDIWAGIKSFGAGTNATTFLSLSSGEHSGRLLSVKVPALTAGVWRGDKEVTQEMLVAALDRFNARQSLGLIPARSGDTSDGITVIDSSTGNMVLKMIRGDEKPAVACVNGWFVFSSNAGVLRKLVSANKARVLPDFRGDPVRWSSGMMGSGANACAWADLERTGESLQNILAVYSLVMLARGVQAGDDSRETLELMQKWLGAVKTLGVGSFHMRTRSEASELLFRVGEE